MSERILFVFEGEKTEATLLNSFKKYFFKENESSIIHATFNTDIYTLYKEVKEDEYLDIVEVIRDRKGNADRLNAISRDDISEVFLFFDYDGHAPAASDEKINELLEYFNDETGHGKLYLSYPMIEAIKHLKEGVNFESTTVDAKKNIRYKNIVHNSCDISLRNLSELSEQQWKIIIEQHNKKAWYLITNNFSLPDGDVSQETIFRNQLDKFINPNSKVAVLGSFPLLLAEYYGVSKLPALIA